LADEERRRLVASLSRGAPEPVSQEELSTALAAHRHEKSREAVMSDERQDATLALHHKHLPSLSAAGLIERDDGAITLTEHPALRDSGILELVADDVDADAASLDALCRALSDARRRTILDVLSHQFGAIHVETLARELEAKAQDLAESEVPAADVEHALTPLYHVDLPHLSEAELIEYDAEARTVEYTGHPALRVPWMHSVFQPSFRESITGESDAEGIGEIEGREQVISFGQSLCDQADDELFCMFTDTQLLEAGCLARIRDAARERDVDVYLGTRDPVIRENVPEVIVWEPNTDWLNLPTDGDRVGRLLMADREAVMLGTLTEEQHDGLHEEQAIIGESEQNTLVTMICQLVSPHLEAITEETDDIAARIPL
jgi:hypothetical protein